LGAANRHGVVLSNDSGTTSAFRALSCDQHSVCMAGGSSSRKKEDATVGMGFPRNFVFDESRQDDETGRRDVQDTEAGIHGRI